MLKPFRRPRLWLALWVAMTLAVVVGSLASPPPAPDVRGGDKWLHLGTYLLVTVAAVQVFRRGRSLILAAAYLVALGAGLELAQGALTAIRVMDWRDAVANALGVAIGLGAALLPGRDGLLALERSWHARRSD